MLRGGLDGFVGRAVLARLAKRSIDVQYYMFHQDTVGRLFIKELVAAADRGVRVRFLLDDMYGGEADDVWLALDSHPSFEVRLFNPFVRGSSKNLQLPLLSCIHSQPRFNRSLSQGNNFSLRNL